MGLIKKKLFQRIYFVCIEILFTLVTCSHISGCPRNFNQFDKEVVTDFGGFGYFCHREAVDKNGETPW